MGGLAADNRFLAKVNRFLGGLTRECREIGLSLVYKRCTIFSAEAEDLFVVTLVTDRAIFHRFFGGRQVQIILARFGKAK